MKYLYDLRYTRGWWQVPVKTEKDKYHDMIAVLAQYDSDGSFSNGDEPGTLRFEKEDDAVYFSLRFS